MLDKTGTDFSHFTKFLLMFLSLALFSYKTQAASISASTCNLNDIANAISVAASGDTVIVPAGTCAWKDKLTITKGVTLQSQGKGKTIVKNSLDPATYTYENFMIDYDPASPTLNEPFRVTGFEFDGNRNGGGVRIKLYGPTLITKVRLDHNYFHDSTYVQSYPNRCIMWGGFAYGVTDHNEFQDCYKTFDVEGGRRCRLEFITSRNWHFKLGFF
ncbi:MAG: hypothetical protein ACXVCP_02100 [Bdellovibrio sp.]